MKGGMLFHFGVGDHVIYRTKRNVSGSEFIDRNFGTVVKLHKSCSSGVAEIKPSNGTAKISRRLINLERA